MKHILIGLCALVIVNASWAAENPRAILHTSLGAITLELFAEQSPQTVQNFINYAKSGHYDGTIFHRVVPRFVIQTGGFTADMVQKPTLDPVVNESANRLHNDRWTVAMARTDDPDSATSQFFINLRMNPNLDFQRGEPGYTVFGKVVDGQYVAAEISRQPTATLFGHDNVPVEPIVIQRVELLQ